MVMLSLVSNSQLINDWYYKFDTHIEKIANLFENTETKNYMFSKKYQEIVDDISQMAADSSGLERWIEYKKKKHALEEMGMDWFIKEGARLSMDENTNIAEVYSWSFFNKWVDEYSESHPELRDFTLEKYSKAIRDFKNLEKESMEINRLRTLHSQIESLDQSIVPCEAERVLRREATKKMRHLPIRSLVQDYASHIQLMKPCWMVSPLALSSYLEYGKVNFDVVIFDEASQMKIENALGAIARSKQVVVIGDEHQLPPTSFFGVSLEGDEDEDDDVNEETGFESILQKSISMLNGSEAYLKYHYRSSSEDLIAFSNYHIYGNRLITFPNPQNSSGVEFKFVKGVYDGSVITYSESGEKEKHAGARTNLIEAEEVANLCISHAQERPGKTLGVIAFSKAQEQAIRDALEEKLSKEYPHLSEYLDETSDKKDSFFIKNLESVQGDERDVIILSICYGPNKLGEVRNHFGPINSASGYRRLNVAVTRAKDKLICVTSMRFSDMNPSPSARGAILLQKYLEYAEKGWKVLEGNLIANSGSLADHDSDFEACVEKALVDVGYVIHRQVGVSGFKIDLAIVNPKNNTDYVLGIECDGAAYHSSKSARVRDRMRQDILEARGWRIYRTWSQHWYTHKQDVLNDIVQYVQRIMN
jgi:very-short-patch-repair endonuclease